VKPPHRRSAALRNLLDVFRNTRAAAPWRIGIAEENDEFVSAHAEHKVACANGVAKRRDGFAKYFIAGSVSVSVVVEFEVVDVEVHQTDAATFRASTLNDRRQEIRKCAPIECACEFVDRREAMKFEMRLLEIKPFGEPNGPRSESRRVDRS
jgi:hypothetical protein